MADSDPYVEVTDFDFDSYCNMVVPDSGSDSDSCFMVAESEKNETIVPKTIGGDSDLEALSFCEYKKAFNEGSSISIPESFAGDSPPYYGPCCDAELSEDMKLFFQELLCILIPKLRSPNVLDCPPTNPK